MENYNFVQREIHSRKSSRVFYYRVYVMDARRRKIKRLDCLSIKSAFEVIDQHKPEPTAEYATIYKLTREPRMIVSAWTWKRSGSGFTITDPVEPVGFRI